MRLNNFLGGMSTKFIPNLIQDNACVYAENVNLATGALTNIKELSSVEKARNSHPYFYKNKWNYYPKGSTFTETGEILYIADGTNIKKCIDGETVDNLIIDAPVYAPTVVETDKEGVVYGEGIQYCYTYYNENDGSESAPSSFSVAINVGKLKTQKSDTVWTGMKQIKITNIVASPDKQVTHIRLYRKTSTLSNYELILSLPNENLETIDNFDFSYSAIQPKLQTYGFNLKIDWNLTPPYAAKYIVAYQGTLFASGTGKNANWLYYSESYSPFMWGTGAIKFDDNITGLGVIQSGILVFCRSKTYILYGNVGAFSKQLLLPATGCVNGASIVNMQSGCIWQATDGYYLYSNGLQNITYEKLGSEYLKPIISAHCDDEAYYALQEDGKILVINSRLNFAIYYFSAANAIGIHCALNKLHVCDGKNLMAYSGDNADIKFKSKHYTEQGISMYKNFKTIYVYSEGDLQFKAYIDDRLVADVPLKEKGVTEVKVDQHNRTGYYIWFEIEGTGSVKEIEFIAEARQNGR